MTTSQTIRQERVDYARHLVANNPSISKRGLQVSLREEFGVGLSDTIRRRVLQDANTPAVLRSRLSTYAFTAIQRKDLKDYLRQAYTPYGVTTINTIFMQYRQMGQQAKAEGKTFRQFVREFRRAVKQEAKEMGWLITSTTPEGREKGRRVGQVDIFKILKYFRDQSIDKGEYKPIPRHKPKTDRGDIERQKTPYQERQSERAHARVVEGKRQKIEGWIDQKDVAIGQATGERKYQLEQERERLVIMLRGVK